MANYGKRERTAQRAAINGVAHCKTADEFASDTAVGRSPISITEWKSRGATPHRQGGRPRSGCWLTNAGDFSKQEKQAMVLRAIFSEEITDHQLDAMLEIAAGLSSHGRTQDQAGAQDLSEEGAVTDVD